MKTGDSVLVQDQKTSRWSIEATVVSKRNKRSYNIEIDGRYHIQNRRFLKPVIAPKEIAPGKITPKETAPKETCSDKKMNKLHVKEHNLGPRRNGRRVTFHD